MGAATTRHIRRMEIAGKHSQPSSLPEGPPGPVDHSVLAESFGGDEAAARDTLGLFRLASDREAAKLRKAVAGIDLVQVRHVSHSIKGSSATVGACELSNVCQRIEQASREADWNTIGAYMGVFEDAIERVHRYIDSMLSAVAPA